MHWRWCFRELHFIKKGLRFFSRLKELEAFSGFSFEFPPIPNWNCKITVAFRKNFIPLKFTCVLFHNNWTCYLFTKCIFFNKECNYFSSQKIPVEEIRGLVTVKVYPTLSQGITVWITKKSQQREQGLTAWYVLTHSLLSFYILIRFWKNGVTESSSYTLRNTDCHLKCLKSNTLFWNITTSLYRWWIYLIKFFDIL
jgi:hypothetical protein